MYDKKLRNRRISARVLAAILTAAMSVSAAPSVRQKQSSRRKLTSSRMHLPMRRIRKKTAIRSLKQQGHRMQR